MRVNVIGFGNRHAGLPVDTAYLYQPWTLYYDIRCSGGSQRHWYWMSHTGLHKSLSRPHHLPIENAWDLVFTMNHFYTVHDHLHIVLIRLLSAELLTSFLRYSNPWACESAFVVLTLSGHSWLHASVVCNLCSRNASAVGLHGKICNMVIFWVLLPAFSSVLNQKLIWWASRIWCQYQTRDDCLQLLAKIAEQGSI